MNFLCKYSDIFGKVGEGAHSIRFLNIAIVDTILTLVGAYLIAEYFEQYNIWQAFGILMLLSLVFHRLFCVKSTLTMMVFGKSF